MHISIFILIINYLRFCNLINDRYILFLQLCKHLFYVLLAFGILIIYICKTIKKNQFTVKTLTTLALAALLTLALSGFRVCTSQTVAVGHVSAEVVESVSAASNAITSFEIDAINAPDTKQLEQAYLNAGTIDLGVITIHSGKDITCNVVVKPATLSDAAGNDFTLSPSVQNNTFASAMQPNGSMKMELGGKTNMARNQASGLYQGSYTVVFAYN